MAGSPKTTRSRSTRSIRRGPTPASPAASSPAGSLRRTAAPLAALLLLPLLAAVPAEAGNARHVVLEQATEEIPASELLDVGIEIFDHGLPEHDRDKLERLEEKKGVFLAVREAEARYIPAKLRDVLESTGFWGAVRVVPEGTESLDLTVSGEIHESSGGELALWIEVHDATGRRWLDGKYKAEADPAAYEQDGHTWSDEPFLDLYHEIANDLARERRERDPGELARVRQVARLRFAADLVPMAYGDHLERDRKDRFELVRLPAEGDPLMERVEEVRFRDQLFVDTLSESYGEFVERMDEPYEEWRRLSWEEERARAKVRRQARRNVLIGIGAILGGVLSEGGGRAGAAAREAAVYGGSVAVGAGVRRYQEAKIHVEALRELAASLEAEVDPMLVEVEGRTLRLAGTLETQYGTWRELLRRMFLNETGFTVDPDSAGDELLLPDGVEEVETAGVDAWGAQGETAGAVFGPATDPGGPADDPATTAPGRDAATDDPAAGPPAAVPAGDAAPADPDATTRTGDAETEDPDTAGPEGSR